MKIDKICEPCQNHVHRMCEGKDCQCVRHDKSAYIQWDVVGPELLEVAKEVLVALDVNGCHADALKLRAVINKAEGK